MVGDVRTHRVRPYVLLKTLYVHCIHVFLYNFGNPYVYECAWCVYCTRCFEQGDPISYDMHAVIHSMCKRLWPNPTCKASKPGPCALHKPYTGHLNLGRCAVLKHQAHSKRKNFFHNVTARGSQYAIHVLRGPVTSQKLQQ